MIESLQTVWQQVQIHLPLSEMDSPYLTGSLAGAILVGALLLVFGRVVHRGALAVVGIALGVLLGPVVAAAAGVDVLIARVAMAGVLGTLGVVAARLVWVLGLAALAVGLTAVGVVLHHMQWIPLSDLPEFRSDLAETWPGFLLATWHYLYGTGLEVYQRQGVVLGSSAVAAGVAAGVTGLLLPTCCTVFMTSLVGALVVVAGAQGAFLASAGQPVPEAMGRPIIALSSIVVLAAAGWVVQGIAARKAARKAKKKRQKQDEEQQPAGEKPESSKGGK
ncbi:MAG: hypothetical protein ACLFV7_12825 [Phycisphaerae bacterium]